MTPILPTALLFLKAMALLGLGLYVVFALVIVRQEQLMANVLEESFEPVLRLITLTHLVASVATFLLALLIL